MYKNVRIALREISSTAILAVTSSAQRPLAIHDAGRQVPQGSRVETNMELAEIYVPIPPGATTAQPAPQWFCKTPPT